MPILSFTTTVIRPEDLLVLQFEFLNVDLTPPKPDQPGRLTGSANSYILVHLQAQHIAERAYFQATENVQQSQEEVMAGQLPPPGNEPPEPPGAVLARLAGASRLAYVLPAGESVDYTLAGLLDALTRLPLSVAPVSAYDPRPGCAPLAVLLRLLRQPPPPVITQPQPTQTALELPYRLVLSPDPQASWQHALAPVTRGLRTELWHTRLGSRRPDGDPRLRAIWSPDFQPTNLQNHDNLPFRMSLDARDRNELVHLTSNYNLDLFTPTPLSTERVMLTALGAWLSVRGDWNPPQLSASRSLTVEQWRHKAMMGRDQYVQVVYSGYLLPTGHRASVIKVTERKFFFQDFTQPPGMVAYLFQSFYIVAREFTRTFTRRELPFRTIVLRTRTTPNLADPQASEVMPGKQQEAFWPRVVAGAGIIDFPFQLAATDWDGRTVEFSLPMIFVSKDIDLGSAPAAVAAYNAEAVLGPRRRREFAGQGVAFAPAAKPGDTTLETRTLSFGAVSKPGEAPRFLPEMSQAEVDIPAVNQLLGHATASTITWEPSYLAATGTAIGNAGQVFARLPAPTALNFVPDKAGGLVAPNISISGLSRSLGPVGGPIAAMVSGKFNPLDIFSANVKLLGGISLRDIIKDLLFADAAGVGLKLPQFISERLATMVRTRYQWQLSQAELVNTGLFIPNAGAVFKLEAIVETPLNGAPPVFRVEGLLTNFSIVLLPSAPLIRLNFTALTFKAEQDKKPDVSVQFGQMDFLGVLAFVNTLSKVVPLDGFNDPPSLELVPPPNTGLNVGFSMGLPTIGIGIMTLQNVSLSAGFYLPFVDKPTNFRFAFCEREQPFTLTVSLFGGGGFFGIELGIDKVVLIEAALEFGASVALNLGVASGQASIMAGFYFQKAGADFQLTGYLRASGSLSVLGIISITCEFYLGLTYASKSIIPHGGKLWGQAKLTVKIEILFFSTSVSISLEREFAGSDPTFHQLVTPDAWAAYCAAYADYPPVPGA